MQFSAEVDIYIMFWAYDINGWGHPKSKQSSEDGAIHKYTLLG